MIINVTNYFDFLFHTKNIQVCLFFLWLPSDRKKNYFQKKEVQNKLKPIKTYQFFTGFQMHFVNRNNRSLHLLYHICETSCCFLDSANLKCIEPCFAGVIFRSVSSRILFCSFVGKIFLYFYSCSNPRSKPCYLLREPLGSI